MTIVEFLTVQYDEAEQAAKQVRQPYRLYVSAEGRISEPKRVDDLHAERVGEYEQWADGGDRMPNDITNWSLIYDPERVLADIASKRAIVARHAECGTGYGYCDDGGHGIDGVGCAELFDLAAPFSAEPGYQQEWTVE